MSTLTIHSENQPDRYELIQNYADIVSNLAQIGVQFERWEATQDIPEGAGQDAILDAYADSTKRLIDLYGFKSVDVIKLSPDHPDREGLRKKFLSEHIHSEFEVRFFVDGQGLFFLHTNDKVYAVLCEKGDLISVPDGVKHWFDMGPRPSFTCIRLFSNPEGWVAQYTGNPIADSFPTLENFPACRK